jgi:energy-converting hydrogenase Eha subunit F
MAMGAGVTTVLSCLLYFKSVDGFLPGMLVNLATMLGAHYWLGEEGGWGNNPLPVTYPTQSLLSKWRQYIRKFNPKLYLGQYLPQHNQAYLLLGFYIFTTTYAALYLLPQEIVVQYPVLYKVLYYSVTLVTTLLFSFPIWPKEMKNKHLLAWIWYGSIFYTLFFVGGMLAILSSFQLPQLMLLMLNLVMAILFIHSAMAFMMFIVGLGAAIYLLHWALILGDLPGINVSLQFRFIYALLLFSSSLIALFKHKQSHQEIQDRNFLLKTTQKETNKALLEALKHREKLSQMMCDESMSLFTSVQEVSEKLEKETHHLKDIQVTKSALQTIQQAKEKIKAAATYFGQIIYQLNAHMRLHVSTVSLQDLIDKAMKDLKCKQDPSLRSQIIVQYNTQQSHIQCDAKAIQQLLRDGLDYAQQHAQDQQQPIFLSIADTTLGYPITAVPGYTKKVAALCITVATRRALPRPLALYVGEVSHPGWNVLKANKALSIIQNERIVAEHYGAVEFLEKKHDCTQIYVIPLRLREVRPETIDALDMDPNTPIAPHDTIVHPQEEELLKTIAMYPEIDMDMVQKAIQLIKKYHASVKRKSGEPFYLHPIAVAQILLQYTKDQDTILASLLHDTVEDTRLSLSQIVLNFNEAVKNIVDGVTHLESDIKTHKRIQLSTHENIQKLLDVKDERVLYVKLADRLHNMRTIEGHSSLEKQKKIAEETLQFFVPIARHIQLNAISDELKSLSSKVLGHV